MPLEDCSLSVLAPGAEPEFRRGYALQPASMPTYAGIFPARWSHAVEGRDPARVQTQCLLEATAGARIDVTVEFLQQVRHTLPLSLTEASPNAHPAVAGAEHHETWIGLVPRRIHIPDLVVADVPQCIDRTIHIDAGSCEHGIRGADGIVCGTVCRRWQALRGRIAVSSVPLADQVHRISVAIDNTTDWSGDERNDALEHALIATETIIDVQRGELVSMGRPPSHLRRHASACRNLHTWPVLVGVPGERRRIVSSAAVRTDYPDSVTAGRADDCAPGSGDSLAAAEILAVAATSPHAAAYGRDGGDSRVPRRAGEAAPAALTQPLGALHHQERSVG